MKLFYALGYVRSIRIRRLAYFKLITYVNWWYSECAECA